MTTPIILPSTFKELLVVLAGGERNRQDLADALGRGYWQLYYWSRTDFIPDKYWDDVIALAARKRLDGIDRDYLKRLKKERERRERREHHR